MAAKDIREGYAALHAGRGYGEQSVRGEDVNDPDSGGVSDTTKGSWGSGGEV